MDTLLRQDAFAWGLPVEALVNGASVSEDGPIAQRLEPPAHNRPVPGSNPGGPTTLRSEIVQSPLSCSASISYAQSALRTFAMNTTETARPRQIHSFRAGDQTVSRHPLDTAQGVQSRVTDQAPVRKRRGFFYVSANVPRATSN